VLLCHVSLCYFICLLSLLSLPSIDTIFHIHWHHVYIAYTMYTTAHFCTLLEIYCYCTLPVLIKIVAIRRKKREKGFFHQPKCMRNFRTADVIYAYFAIISPSRQIHIMLRETRFRCTRILHLQMGQKVRKYIYQQQQQIALLKFCELSILNLNGPILLSLSTFVKHTKGWERSFKTTCIHYDNNHRLSDDNSVRHSFCIQTSTPGTQTPLLRIQ